MAWVFPDEASEATERLRDPSSTDTRLSLPCGRLRADEWPVVCAGLEALPIEIDPVPTSRVWGSALALASEHDLSVYDAVSLELALRMRLPLATLDRALAAAARTAGVDVPNTA